MTLRLILWKAPFSCLNSRDIWNGDMVINTTLVSMNYCWNCGNDISRIKYFREGTTFNQKKPLSLPDISPNSVFSVNWIIIFPLIKPMVSSRPKDDQIWSYRKFALISRFSDDLIKSLSL